MRKAQIVVTRAWDKLRAGVGGGRNLLGRLAKNVVGDLSWQPPMWGQWCAQRLQQHRTTSLCVLAFIVLGSAGYYWRAPLQQKWLSLRSIQPDQQQRHELTSNAIQITPPSPATVDNEGRFKIKPVRFHFKVSAAPLAKVGKEANDIILSPQLAGHWNWVSASELEFTPQEDWPIDQHYRVKFGNKALAPHVSLNDDLEFDSPKFSLKIREAKFYQDPQQFNLRKAVYEVVFSHPVDANTFEKNLKLEASDAAQLGLTNNAQQKLLVVYDKPRLTATVHSAALPIPAQNSSLSLIIDAGVVAQRGGNKTPESTQLALAIPGLFSLDIEELKQLIVTGESGEPENVLNVVTAMSVSEKEIARVTHAWLLPLQNPEQKDADTSKPYAWSDPAEISSAVLARAKRITLNAIPSEQTHTEAHGFKFVAEPNRYMLVRIDKGLKSSGGYQLGATRDEIIRIKQFAPELAIMSKGSLLALSGDKKLPLLVRDLPGVKIEIGRLLPQQLQHLVTQSDGDMSKPQFYSNVSADNLTERFEKKINLPTLRGKTQYETVDFGEYLNKDNSDRRGVFLLSVRGFDPAAKEQNKNDDNTSAPEREMEEGAIEESEMGEQENIAPESLRDSRLVVVTDLGIITKQSSDGARDVFVQSIANGQPVNAATVEVWAKNGAVLVSQATDASGYVHLPSLNGMQREKQAVVLVVRKAGDLSFLPLNRYGRALDMSRFDVGGLRTNTLPNQIQAYLFSDRGIYRPGDEMHIGMIAKSANWAQKLNGLPVEVEVLDPRGILIRREVIKLGTAGMAEFSHATQDSSPTGTYTLNLNLARETGTSNPSQEELAPLRLGSLSVRVQEFLPDRMKVATTLSHNANDAWIHPKDLNAFVNVQNLFGTPAQQRRIESHLTLTPAFPAFAAYPDYQFFDPQRMKEKFEEDLPKAESDANGNAQINLNLQRYENATFKLHVLAKAFEPEGGRSVASDVQALVSDRPYLIGYKADGDLSYVTRNSVRKANLIAINSKAQKTALEQLKLVRIERKMVSVLMKQSNGLYKYESRPKETVLNENPFNIAMAGQNLQLATQTPGNFAYLVRDAQGLEVARIDYSVAGNGNVSRSLDRNAELQLALNRKDYNPGDEIEINIRAPYAGAGLITIERDKVFAHKWFTASQNASVQKITLPKDFEGNGYVSVQFVRDIASDEIYMSPLSYGVAPFATSLARRTNAIKLQAPSLVKPGQTVTMQLQAKSPSRAVIFAVDEGILQVARYQNPDPLKYFFQKRALEVSTQQTLDLILPEFKKLMQAAAPGGDADGLLGKNLNPFKRKRDKPVVYWSGIVDVNGTRELNYKVPESFNGALRIMAVTVNDDTTAAATAQTEVRGDIILLPTVPVSITPGDEIEIGVGVANNTPGSGKDAPVKLNLEVASGLEIVGDKQKTLSISERAEAATSFKVRAKSGAQAQLGSASVIFSAQVKNSQARLSTDVSVRPASAYVSLVQTGTFKGSGSLKAQGDMYPNFQRSELAVSTSPWGFVSGLMQYLNAYPYGCTEQITSQTFPAVILAAQPELASELLKTKQRAQGMENALDKSGLPDANKVLQRYISQIRTRQTSDGGIAMWPGAQADVFASNYVASLLVEARERKLNVPNDMLQRLNSYLQAQLAQSAQQDHDWQIHEWRMQVTSVYWLMRQGILTTAALTNLRNHYQNKLDHLKDKAREVWLYDSGVAYLAASYAMLKQENIGESLARFLLPYASRMISKPQVWYWEYYNDPLIYNTSLMHVVARHFPKLLNEFPTSYWNQITQWISSGYYTSHSSASSILAVDAFAHAVSNASSGKLTVSSIDQKGQEHPITIPSKFMLNKMLLALDTAQVKLSNQAELPVFYSWAQSGFERNVPQQAQSQGIEIIHEFLDASGKAVTQARLGDELTVRVRLRSTERNLINNVVLVDILPGGLEPILNNPSESEETETPIWQRRLGGKSSWALDFADIREDRVIFYGNVNKQLVELTYKVRATNSGNFVVPAAYAEAMYERRIFGRSVGQSFKVVGAQ